jgi:hypothetical protein
VEEKPSETECHHSVHSDAQSHEEHIQAATQEITNNGRSRALSEPADIGRGRHTALVSMFNFRIARKPEVIANGFPKPTYRDKSESC